MLRILSSSKSRSIAGPIEIRSPSRRAVVAIKNLLDLSLCPPLRFTSLIETTIKSKEKICHAPLRHHRSRAVLRYHFHSRHSNPGEKAHERQEDHSRSARQGDRADHPFLGRSPRLHENHRSPRWQQ